MKKSIAIAALIIVLFSGLAYTANSYREESVKLENQLQELKDTQSKLKENYNSLKNNYSETLEEFRTLEDNFETLQNQFSTYRESEKFTVRAHTLSEVKDFLEKDTTDENEYDEEDYNCYDFTNDMMNNAISENIAVGLVYITMDIHHPDKSDEEGAHSLVAFRTIDKGTVYVEPQDDAVIHNFEVGDDYLQKRAEARPGNVNFDTEWIVTKKGVIGYW